jgi:hypothetical protein
MPVRYAKYEVTLYDDQDTEAVEKAIRQALEPFARYDSSLDVELVESAGGGGIVPVDRV